MVQALGNAENQIGGTLTAVGSVGQALGRTAFQMSGRLHSLGVASAAAYGNAEMSVGGTLVAVTEPIPPRESVGAGLACSYTGWGG